MNIMKVAEHLRDILDENEQFLSPPILPDNEFHTHEHLDKILQDICDGTVIGEKAHRHLGWVQGVLTATGLATVERMMAVNKWSGGTGELL